MAKCGACPYFELMNSPIGKINIICKCGEKSNVTVKEYSRLASQEKQIIKHTKNAKNIILNTQNTVLHVTHIYVTVAVIKILIH